MCGDFLIDSVPGEPGDLISELALLPSPFPPRPRVTKCDFSGKSELGEHEELISGTLG